MEQPMRVASEILARANTTEVKQGVLRALDGILREDPKVGDGMLTTTLARMSMYDFTPETRDLALNALGATIAQRFDQGKVALDFAAYVAKGSCPAARAAAQKVLQVTVEAQRNLADTAVGLAKAGLNDTVPEVRMQALWSCLHIGKTSRRLAKKVSGMVHDAEHDRDREVRMIAKRVFETVKRAANEPAARPVKPVARRPVVQKATPKKTTPSEWRGYAIF